MHTISCDLLRNDWRDFCPFCSREPLYITAMVKKIVFFILLILPFAATSQQAVRPLPPNINQPSVNLYAPFISGNGKALVYLSDYADDGHHIMYYSRREGFEWDDGKEVNKLLNRPTLNFRGGFSLNYTGDQLFITSRKTGLGGFDIWMSQWKGNDWTAPVNLGSPLNSRENEGSPVISADGELVYFMRCEKMEEYGGAENCRIMVSKWNYNRWGEPEPLPENINTGNSQTPRILGDGETLIFSSDKFGGKGGLDLYMTQKTGNGWSDPVALDFINSDRDDAFVSIPAKGRYMYVSRKGPRNYELVEQLIPEEFRPDKVLRLNGKIQSPEPVNLLVFDVNERDRLWNEQLKDGGSFSVILKEGSIYDLSINVDKPGYGYYAEVLELDDIGRIDRRNLPIQIKPLAKGDTISGMVRFEGTQIPSAYVFEMRRIGNMIKLNNRQQIHLEVCQEAYREDSIQHSDLTEVRYDTIFNPIDTVLNDPLSVNGRKLYWAQDSVQIVTTVGDTLRMPTNWFTVKPIYHNDRTEEQEAAVREFLDSRGIDSATYVISRKRIPARETYWPETSNSEIPEEEENQKPPKTERLIAIFKD